MQPLLRLFSQFSGLHPVARDTISLSESLSPEPFSIISDLATINRVTERRFVRRYPLRISLMGVFALRNVHVTCVPDHPARD